MAPEASSSHFICASIGVWEHAKRVKATLWDTTSGETLKAGQLKEYERQIGAWMCKGYKLAPEVRHVEAAFSSSESSVHVCACGISLMSGRLHYRGDLSDKTCKDLRQLFKKQLVNALAIGNGDNEEDIVR